MIGIFREVAAEFRNPVMMYSIGKDSSVMLHLARKAFFPGKPPFPLLHVDTLWKFREMIAFRDAIARQLGIELIVHTNEDGVRRGINPIASGSALHTAVMKTEALKQALDRFGFDAALGGARRDEEKSRAKERIFSLRGANHSWDPRNQRPELWRLYNTRLRERETMRVFPLSNWTEHDIWEYITAEEIPVVPLYFAAMRPVVDRGGAWIMVDDDRLPLEDGETPQQRLVRFRTLGCYPLTGAIEFGCHNTGRDPRGTARYQAFRASGSLDRQRRGRGDGAQKARGLFLMAAGCEARHARSDRDLLRFLTCGSVDDGKSTLIGRLLHDCALIFDDQLETLERESKRFGTTGGNLDFSLLLDGLEDERQQRITIDVAYRFFATPARSFVVADTPGHEQYTRNMATGASTCDLAVILVDARNGIVIQTRRHAFICSLLGIRHVVLAVNKMDLVGFDEGRFAEITADFSRIQDRAWRSGGMRDPALGRRRR